MITTQASGSDFIERRKAMCTIDLSAATAVVAVAGGGGQGDGAGAHTVRWSSQ